MAVKQILVTELAFSLVFHMISLRRFVNFIFRLLLLLLLFFFLLFLDIFFCLWLVYSVKVSIQQLLNRFIYLNFMFFIFFCFST